MTSRKPLIVLLALLALMGLGTIGRPDMAPAEAAQAKPAQAGPPAPYIPNKTAARKKLGSHLVKACHGVTSINIVGKGAIWNGVCLYPNTKSQAWKGVRCLREDVNPWLIPRWDCQGYMQWETTELSVKGPCLKQLAKQGHIFPGIRTLITAWRRAYVFYASGDVSRVAIRYIGGWQGCAAGYPA